MDSGFRRNDEIGEVAASGRTMTTLAEITRSLDDIASATTLESLDALRVALLGKNGAITAALKSLGALPPDERKVARRRSQSREGTDRRRDRRAQGDARKSRARSTPRLRAHRRHAARPSRRARRPASDHAHARSHDRDLRAARLRPRRRSRDRGRLSQLRSAELPAASSGARDARHVLFRGRSPAAHAHLAGADPRGERARRRRSA